MERLRLRLRLLLWALLPQLCPPRLRNLCRLHRRHLLRLHRPQQIVPRLRE